MGVSQLHLRFGRRLLERRETLAAMDRLAALYMIQRKDAEAETLNGQTLELRRRVLGPEDADTGVCNSLKKFRRLSVDGSQEGDQAIHRALGRP